MIIARIIADGQIYFNPRSREGSDTTTVSNDAGAWIFQSTLPRGERLVDRMMTRIGRGISIHAPARGATLLSMSLMLFAQFQSTLPRGERPRRNWRSTRSDRNFNPRSREGSDSAAKRQRGTAVRISIHAPARGATSLTVCLAS